MNNDIQNIKSILLWLTSRLPLNRQERYISILDEWCLTISRWIKTRGEVETLKLLKAVRLHCTRYLSGEPLMTNQSSIAVDKKGIPRCLRSAKPLIMGDVYDLRLLLTLLILSRCIKGWGEPNFSSITDTGKCEASESLFDEISTHVDLFSEKIPHEFEAYHITAKAGPNGLALDCATEDLKLLVSSPITKSIVKLGGEILRDKLNTVMGTLESIPVMPLTKLRSEKTLRRLSVKEDKEGKLRVFAILDYWSQTSLQRLHKEINAILKKIPADCTFDQGSRLGRLKPNGMFHSLDLSNATDRFPIALQVKILSRLTSEEIAQAWKQIMVGLPFDYKGNKYTYAVGQPMGAYSSWPLFALSHHCCVQHAAKMGGLKLPYSNYLLLGDDIVLADDIVAKNYRTILAQLDVPISDAKSHVSKTTYEFAKRWIHNGYEITGLPLSGILNYQGPATALSWFSTIQRNWSDSNMTLSRSEITQLLRHVLRHKLDHKIWLETKRLWEAMMLPIGKIRQESNFLRNWTTYSHLLRAYLGCNVTYEHVLLALDQLVPTIKIKVSTEAIKLTVKGFTNYLKQQIKVVRQHEQFDRGMLSELPQLISTLPVLEASRAYAQNAQLELDRMEDLFAQGIEEEILDKPVVIGFDPTRLISKDAGEIRFMSHSKVAKELKLSIGLYLKEREYKRSDAFWLNPDAPLHLFKEE